MLPAEEVEELKSKLICSNCIGEKYLRELVGRTGVEETCSYCSDTAPCITVGRLSEHVSGAFEAHYVRTTNEPDALQWMMMKDDESDYDFERSGEVTVEAIEMAAEVPTKAAEDVQQILEDEYYDHSAAEMGEESEFAPDAYYERRGTSDAIWQEEWRAFERSLKTEARFFSQFAAAHLRSVFAGIDDFRASDGRPMVVQAGPGSGLSYLYRARAFQSEAKLLEAIKRPDLHIGPPPPGTASHGRMNARGISVFYGANSQRVAIAEVRPPVGSNVVVARFDIIRPLRLLDLTALRKVSVRGSIFDPSYADTLERGMFLRFLSQRITKPVMPDDEEMDYLATQAVADFLATDGDQPFDGIIFPSAQVKTPRTVNVVLFQKAARVEQLDLPQGSKISSSAGHHTNEGWEPQYSVTESVPPPPVDKKPKPSNDFPDFPDLSWRRTLGSYDDLESDGREVSLKTNHEDINVHHVSSAQFRTSKSSINRARHTDSRLASDTDSDSDF
ncbi:RES family NAD+ phosphorylase [Devosia sp.]|uniref:RES family NAD+ phosphorylase n=1 Tax=Devosia sp. TaxID=1871048 RepID=UPI002931C57C|nr:RES family NAD+ phosphorylase [Devosia sp.]